MEGDERCLVLVLRLLDENNDRHAKGSHSYGVVDVHARNDYSLAHASKRGFLRVVDLLLSEHGADVHTFDHDYRRRFIKFARISLFSWDVGPPVRDDAALRYAAEIGHVEIVDLLVGKHKANVNADNDGALRWAASDGHVHVVDLLLGKYNAKVNADNDGALRWAAFNGHVHVVDLLLGKYNAKVNADNGGALRWAVERGHDQVVKLLLDKYGANVNACDIRKLTPSGYRSDEVVRLLKEHGALERRSFS